MSQLLNKKMFFNAVVNIVVLTMFIASICHANDDILQLDTLDVIAVSPAESILSKSQSIKIITADDIQQSTANSLIDVLKSQANLNLKSFYGDDRLASIDIRGQGETAVSNVAIFVDGVRINSDTLASADLSSIPLDNIKSVKIIRGGGSVRYGNNAVGGVIDIKTKQASPNSRSLSLQTQYGSFDRWENNISGSIASNKLATSFRVSTLDTNGYRDNGYLESKNYALKFNYKHSDILSFFLNTSLHDDKAGSPGNVSLENFNTSSTTRRSTNTPFDFNETREYRFSIGSDIDLKEAGEMNLIAAYRNRKTDPNVLNFNPATSLLQRENILLSGEYLDLNIDHVYPFQLFNRNTKIESGFSYHHSDYLRSEGEEQINEVRTDASVYEQGTYIVFESNLTNSLLFNIGYRHNWFHAKQLRQSVGLISAPPPVFGYRVTGRQSEDWESEAYEFGLNYQINNHWYVYTNFSRNFRTPNSDELVLASNTLRPQSGNNTEAGFRYYSSKLQLSASIFQLKNRNEIFFGFDTTTLQNVNFNLREKTKRTGFELELTVIPLEGLTLNGNFGYVRPKFQSSDIPHAPRLTANASMQWQLLPWANLLLSTHYVGERYDGNDLSNTLPKLKAYRVEDAELQFNKDNIEFFVGVNNLFNEIYSTIAFSQTFYPQPERNIYSGIRFIF